MKTTLLLLGLGAVSMGASVAQGQSLPAAQPRHAVYLEMLGSNGWYSLNYDTRMLGDDLSLPLCCQPQ